MKKIKLLNTPTPLAGLLIIAALALPGCVADDLKADDSVRAPVQASDNYPITLTKGAKKLAVRPCGDWSKDLADTSDNTSYPNLGCAVQTDLAAMIADPNTLVVPKKVPARYSDSDVAAANRSSSFVNNTNLLSNYAYHSSP
ncbi:MAG: CpaD family pilus assembly lipoprotein [Aestuariivirga sp.]